MCQKIYVVRHCEALGQEANAPLTKEGYHQAKELSHFFTKESKIDRVISSPFLRAQQSIEPLVEALRLQLEIDGRLQERKLSKVPIIDWLEKLEQSFIELDISFEGGESSREATERIVSVVTDILKSGAKSSIIVTHGNLMALLLKWYKPEFGFEEWKNLTNPDVYQLTFGKDSVEIERIWSIKIK